MIFKDVRDGRPYPDHGLSMRDWARIPPRQIRMDELITTKRELRLDALLDEDSTFYGDLFGHAVLWEGQIYLEDGLHRALRAALQQRTVIHVRILNLDALQAGAGAIGAGRSGAGQPAGRRSPRPARRRRLGADPLSTGGRQLSRSVAARCRRPAAGRAGSAPPGLGQQRPRPAARPRRLARRPRGRPRSAGPVPMPSDQPQPSRMSSIRRASGSSTSAWRDPGLRSGRRSAAA